MDGEVRNTEEDFDLPKSYIYSIEVVVDRLKIRKDVDFKSRLVDSLETASEFADGLINVLFSDDGRDYEKK